MSLDRWIRQVLVASAAVLIVGCKPDIPKEYDDIVVADGLRKFMPKEKTSLDGAGGTIFYKTNDPKKLSQQYRDKLDGAGYKSMMKCEDSNVVVGVKGDNTVVSLSFLRVGEETMVHLTKGKMTMVGFPEKAKCEWSDAAKSACDIKGDKCFFRDN